MEFRTLAVASPQAAPPLRALVSAAGTNLRDVFDLAAVPFASGFDFDRFARPWSVKHAKVVIQRTSDRAN